MSNKLEMAQEINKLQERIVELETYREEIRRNICASMDSALDLLDQLDHIKIMTHGSGKETVEESINTATADVVTIITSVRAIEREMDW